MWARWKILKKNKSIERNLKQKERKKNGHSGLYVRGR